MNTNDPRRIHRREWLGATAAAGAALAAPLLLPGGSRGANGASPNNRLNIAAIGTGQRCSFLIEQVLRQGHNIAALCDVDQTAIDATRKRVAQISAQVNRPAMEPQVYGDYRRLLDAKQSIDAVLIAVGSRWHAPLASAVLRAGKHVYCEKPLLRRLGEAGELKKLASESKVVTQYGTHGGSGKAFRRCIEVVQAGLLGQVREVHLWCDGYGPNPPSHDRPAGEDPVPAGLNWDFWLGPAPFRPFKRGVYVSGCLLAQNWLDLCNGMLAGQGAHTFYLPVRALRLGPPTRVEAELPEPLKETYVSQGSFRFDFPARGDLAPLSLWWTDGGKYPPPRVTDRLKAMSGRVPNMGCLLLGGKGDLFAGGWGENGVIRLQGEKRWRGVLDHEAAKAVPVTLPRAPDDNHMAEFLAACQGGPATFTPLEVGAAVCEVFLPGIVAMRLGRPIEWDGAAQKVKRAPEADVLIEKNYRTKWL